MTFHFFAEVLLPRLRRERQALELFHGQCIHVGSQSHGAPRLTTLEHAHDASARYAGADLQPKTPQMLLNQAARARLLIRQLRMLVYVPSSPDHLLLDIRSPAADLRRHRRIFGK